MFKRRFLSRLTWRGPDGERGAVLVMASIVSVAAISATAIAVDISKAVSNKRSLQSVVDLAALDAVRALGDRRGQGDGLADQQHAEKLAKESLIRNNFDPNDTATANSFALVLGKFDFTARTFTVTAVGADQNAVQITAHTTKGWTFRPGDKTYTATGTAALRNNSAIAVGSYLARVDTSGSIFKDLFSGYLNGNVTLVGYTGIAAGSVTLGELRTELGIGTVDALLTGTITLKDLYNATISALTKKGDVVSLQAASDLGNLAAAADSSLSLQLGQLINVAQGGGDAAASADINVLQLAQMAAQVANGTNAVDVSLSPGSLGGLSSLLNASGNSVSIKVVEAPQIAIGPAAQDASGNWKTTAHTAQVRTQIHLKPIGSLLGNLVNIDLPIYAEAASADASLTGVNCDTKTATVLADTELLRVEVGTAANMAAMPNVTVNAGHLVTLNLLGVFTVNVLADSQLLQNGASPQTLTFTEPFNWSNRQTIGGGTSLAGLVSDLNVATSFSPACGLLCGTLNALLSTVLSQTTAILTPVLNGLDSLLNPLLSALGVSLGGADFWAWDLDCHARSLVL